MTHESLPAWLIGEVRDLLAVSSVGLYEFVWLLRSKWSDLSDTELHRIAESALRSLLDDGEVRLVRLQWPGGDVIGLVDNELLQDKDWSKPGPDGSYLAIDKP